MALETRLEKTAANGVVFVYEKFSAGRGEVGGFVGFMEEHAQVSIAGAPGGFKFQGRRMALALQYFEDCVEAGEHVIARPVYAAF